MKKNKGFTLIELLAVIVVLAIIALIATPIVLNLIDNARKGAAEQSATAYVKSIENAVVKDMLNQVNHENKVGYQYDEIDVDIKGTIPTSGTYTLKDGRVETANFCISGYNIEYSNGVSTAKGKCNGTTDEELENTILDKAKALVYENDACKTDGTTYTYMGGCYIKGASTNNYVWYNGFMWRIMGINSDNTVRLITDENVTAITYAISGTALTYATNKGYINDWLNDYFYSNLNNTKSIIKEGAYFCSETLTTSTARTTCTSGNEVTAKVGLLTYDEYLLANTSSSYLNISQSFWTMTPISSYNVWKVEYNGNANSNGVERAYGVRPVINVDATSTITKGDGTPSQYYVLSENKDNDKTGTLSDNVTSGEYVKLEGKTYRVVNKESDGIKLIFDGYYEETAGTTYEMEYGSDNTFTLDSGIGQKLNGDVLTWLGLSNSDKIVETIYYQGPKLDERQSYKAFSNSTYNGVQAKVGLIRVGEMLSSQSSTILTKNYTVPSSYSNSTSYWTMNKYTTASSAWNVNNIGNVYSTFRTSGVRPVIKVKTNLTISKGNGTWNNPYEV